MYLTWSVILMCFTGCLDHKTYNSYNVIEESNVGNAFK